jgi:hypothetical protein
MCQVLISCASIDLNKVIDIIHLNQIKWRHVVPHNFILSGPTCISFMKLHMASHQWCNRNNNYYSTPHPTI